MAKCDLNTIIRVAANEVGYLEKASNANLDHKTANAGKKNYTKYNRDYNAWGGGGAQPMEWCAAFVSWCFVKAYGLEAAKALLCGGIHHYTPTGANRFKKAKRYFKRGELMPKPGDVIYFFNSTKGRIGHVGIVYKVTSSKVYTIEGNTSGASTLITNGGGVKKKSYSLSSTYIDGYGRPKYNDVEIETETEKVTSLELGERLLTNGCEGDDVKELQEALISLGYDCGSWGADGEFGDATELAVEAFQRAYNCVVDGEFGEETYKALVAALKAQEGVKEAKTVLIVNGDCHIRSEPNTSGKKLGVAHRGDKYPYGGKTADNGWNAITYKGNVAYVSGKYSKLA